MDFGQIRHIHFIGIGGIGVSAIARMMLEEGKIVSGSDLVPSVITKELERRGARISYRHRPGNVRGAELLVYTPAISLRHTELLAAKRRGIPVYSYPEILGILSKEKFTIAVAGSHGKTTTTAMIGTILADAKRSPTIIVGSLMKRFKSNFVAGMGPYFLVEACEYKRSFLDLFPRIIVITNIDNDHLDYYRTMANLRGAFREFAKKLRLNDWLVCNPKGKHLASVVSNIRANVVDYTKSPKDFRLKTPGAYNVSNAQAAFAVGKILGLKTGSLKRSLEQFQGTWRRFEYRGKTRSSALLYDDYAHHPTEVRSFLAAVREQFPKKHIVCVFQPHLFSRTRLLLNDFAKSFRDADEVVVADIYAAREKDPGNIHARDLVRAIRRYYRNASYGGSLVAIAARLRNDGGRNTLILTVGAGDIYKVGDMLRFKTRGKVR